MKEYTHYNRIKSVLAEKNKAETWLSLAKLLERELKSAPMGAIDISKTEYKELLVYIH